MFIKLAFVLGLIDVFLIWMYSLAPKLIRTRSGMREYVFYIRDFHLSKVCTFTKEHGWEYIICSYTRDSFLLSDSCISGSGRDIKEWNHWNELWKPCRPPITTNLPITSQSIFCSSGRDERYKNRCCQSSYNPNSRKPLWGHIGGSPYCKVSLQFL